MLAGRGPARSVGLGVGEGLLIRPVIDRLVMTKVSMPTTPGSTPGGATAGISHLAGDSAG
jgi:hypothetical protein